MRPLRSLSTPSLVAIVVFFSVAVGLWAKDFVKPVAHPAKTYPAHDDHPTEKVAIAADPYDTHEKASIFSIDFNGHDLLPVFFVVTNDGDQPVAITNMDVKLVTANRSKLTPLSTNDISRHLVNPQASSPIPLPIPRKKVKGALSQKQIDEINSSQFAAKAVEPHSSQSGFLFFDVGDISAPLAGARLYVSGVNDAKGSELMYFEIPMEKYLGGSQKP